jgi:hypothetical protein
VKSGAWLVEPFRGVERPSGLWRAARVYDLPSAFDPRLRGRCGSGVAPYRQVGHDPHSVTPTLPHVEVRADAGQFRVTAAVAA